MRGVEPEFSRGDDMANDLDMGLVAEGRLHYDSDARCFVIRGEQDGKPHIWIVDDALAKYEGQEVRLVLVTFDTINKVSELVAQGGLKIEDAMVGKSG